MLRMEHSTSGKAEYRPAAPRMLHETSANREFSVSRRSAVKKLDHNGIYCDSCEKPIKGIRYKCSCCPDFDMCSGCMDDYDAELVTAAEGIKLRGDISDSKHPQTKHLFYRMSVPQVRTCPPACQNRASWVHSEISCSACRIPTIIGYRYFCTTCAVSLCESCEQNGAHRIDHNLLKMAPAHIANDPNWNPLIVPQHVAKDMDSQFSRLSHK